MRVDDNQQEGMFSYISPEKRVPADDPLRAIRKMVDEILKEMSRKFRKLYSDVGRPSIAPERLSVGGDLFRGCDYESKFSVFYRTYYPRSICR
jgi:hypothetical protein